MKNWDQESFHHFIVENNVYGFFTEPITLKSGRTSHFYANWRNVVEDVWLTEKLVNFVIAWITLNGIEVDTFFGVPEGATKLGILTQFCWARRQPDYGRGSHSLAMGRARPKEHGAPKDRFFVGQPRGRIVLLEDVTTTGGSSLTVIDQLQETDLNVSALVSLTNRMEKRDDGTSVQEAVEAKGVPYLAMSSALDILPIVYRQQQPGEAIRAAIESEFNRYGVRPLALV